jgi:hypothetical protein
MTVSKLLVLAAVYLSTAASSVCAQQPKQLGSHSLATAAMTDDDVIALASAGMGDDIIIAKIHAAASTTFDTSVAALKALKAAGVSSTVIRVMIDPSAAPAGTASSAAPAAQNVDDPLSPHSPGIWVMAKGGDGQNHLTKLAHVVPKQAKTSGVFGSAMTYGLLKAKVKVVIDGSKAGLELTDQNPAFYAYIPEDNSTFGGSAISIQDFSLVRFDVSSSSRTVDTASFNAWGSSFGTDQKAKQGFSSEAVRPGVYKLTLLKSLPAGEYAFQQAGAAGSAADQKNTGSYFDFGVLPTS